MDLATGWEVGRYWRDGKRKSQEKSDFCLQGLVQKCFSVWICWYVPDLTCLPTLCVWCCWISNLQWPWQSPSTLVVAPVGGRGSADSAPGFAVGPLVLKMLFGQPWWPNTGKTETPVCSHQAYKKITLFASKLEVSQYIVVTDPCQPTWLMDVVCHEFEWENSFCYLTDSSGKQRDDVKCSQSWWVSSDFLIVWPHFMQKQVRFVQPRTFRSDTDFEFSKLRGAQVWFFSVLLHSCEVQSNLQASSLRHISEVWICFFAAFWLRLIFTIPTTVKFSLNTVLVLDL